MKTKKDIIILNNLIDRIKTVVSEKDLKPFKYAFLRNQLKFKKVLEEREEIIEFLKEEFLKDNPTPEDPSQEYQDSYATYINSNEKFTKFLDEEVEIDYYTLDIKDLEEEEFDLQSAEALIGTIIVER